MSILFPNNPRTFCMNADLWNGDLFRWSWRSIIFVVYVLIAAPIRLLAMSQLGNEFAAVFQPPKKLVTSGIYAHVQHPSYIALVLVSVAGAGLCGNLDGVWLFIHPHLVGKEGYGTVFKASFASYFEFLAMGYSQGGGNNAEKAVW
ncbi:hypothetical protein BDZ45DRAFT_735052 [Acephala macrosclerotiorum]|nr:hypothetical protein BDZ45DRAFT_735052 [Acephala macrosclerotiorum]